MNARPLFAPAIGIAPSSRAGNRRRLMADDFSLSIDASFASASARRRRPLRKPRKPTPEPPSSPRKTRPIFRKTRSARRSSISSSCCSSSAECCSSFQGAAVPQSGSRTPVLCPRSRRSCTTCPVQSAVPKPLAAGLVSASLLLLVLNLLHLDPAGCRHRAVHLPALDRGAALLGTNRDCSPQTLIGSVADLPLQSRWRGGGNSAGLRARAPARAVPVISCRDDYLSSLSYTGNDGRVI